MTEEELKMTEKVILNRHTLVLCVSVDKRYKQAVRYQVSRFQGFYCRSRYTGFVIDHRRKRRELRRQRRENRPIDTEDEIHNRVIAGVISFIGYFFEARLKSRNSEVLSLWYWYVVQYVR